jgi:hypothetical protein
MKMKSGYLASIFVIGTLSSLALGGEFDVANKGETSVIPNTLTNLFK